MTDLAEILETFELLGDWEERYRYLIDLGKKIKGLPEEERIPERLVKGCTSQVWLKSEIKDGVYRFWADSDAHIVRGLIALLEAIFDGKTSNEIAATNITTLFTQIGLDQNLSPNRRNGFFAMVQRIEHEALQSVG
jgi:cysteine desulfuration protein SufE